MLDYGLMEFGIISALKYTTYLSAISITIALTCVSLTVVWQEKEAILLKLLQSTLLATLGLSFFGSIHLDGPDFPYNVDARALWFVVLVVLQIVLLMLLPIFRNKTRKSFLRDGPRAVPFALLGGIAGFMIGYPSFGQTSFGQIGAVVFSGFGILLSYAIVKKPIDDHKDSPFEPWIYAASFSFVLSGFFIFTAAGTWGYSVRGFEYCGELYGPHIASENPAMSLGGNSPLNKADQLFYGFCEDALSAFSKTARPVDY